MKYILLLILAAIWFTAVKEEMYAASWFTGTILFTCIALLIYSHNDKATKK